MPESKTGFRPRISLLAFLLGISLVAVGVSHWQTSRQLQSLMPELRKLRSEAGYITVDDNTKFHALAIETGDPNIWKWRMFIPKGTKYQWNIACENIPQTTPPATAGTTGTSNETYWETDTNVLVTARLHENENGDWTLAISSTIGESADQMAGATLTIPAEKIQWMKTSHSTDGQIIGTNETAIRDPKGPIILLQRRPCQQQPDGSFRPSTGTMPGYMIWLTEW